MRSRADDPAFRTTIAYPKTWMEAVRSEVSQLRQSENTGAKPNDIYREALRQYLIKKGYLRDGDQA